MNKEFLPHKYHLEKFYEKLKEVLVKNKKYKESMIISMFDINANKRMEFLENGALSDSEIPPDVIKDLIEKEYIRNGAKLENYVLTAKGVWLLETKNGLIDNEKLISAIDEKFFSYSADMNKRLTDREKIVIFSFISARAFSKDSVVDLMDDIRVEHWGKIIQESCKILKKLGVVETDADDILQQKGNEHPVSSLMRHIDILPRKTRGIYRALGNRRYYLELYEDSLLSIKKLAYLFWRVLDGKLSLDNRSNILEFCNHIAHSECVYIFDINKHEFSVPSYDNDIKEAFEFGCTNRSLWEKQK